MIADHVLQGLKPLRTHLGISASALANRIGVTASSFARYENGSRRIFLDMAVALAGTLGVTVDDLTRSHSPDELIQRFGPARSAPEHRGRRKGTRVIGGQVVQPVGVPPLPELAPQPLGELAGLKDWEL